MELAAHKNQSQTFHFHPYSLSSNFEKQQVYYFMVSTTSEQQFLQLYIRLVSEVSLEYLSADLGTLRTYPIFRLELHLVLETFLNRSNIS